ncbi:MAG: ABC transporter permease, partial [bacterium]
MDIKESLNVALSAMKANKLRSILTTLGIVIGVMTIIGVMSIMQGLQDYVEKELTVLGANTFQVQKYPPIQLGRLDEKIRNRKDITVEHALAIRERAKSVKFVGPEVWHWGVVVKYKNKKTNPDIVLAGGTPEFAINNGYFISEGRFISDFDVDHSSAVAVLGMDIVEELFPFQDPIGKEVRIDAN